MHTKIRRAYGDPDKDREVMEEAGRIIKAGGLVAIPTETVYGLAGDALNPESSKKIYAAKGRPSDNPLIVHIARISDLEKIARDVPGEAYALASRYWPGPLTMVLNKKDIVPYETTGHLSTVAVRLPVNDIAREFIAASGGFIAAPSANLSGRPSCTRASHCIADLDGRIDMIIDGGEVGIGLESTIVDLTDKRPCILRQGYINERMLSDVLGMVEKDPNDTEHPKAPGMKYRHYAPSGSLTIVRGEPEHVSSKIAELAGERIAEGKKTAIIAAHEHISLYDTVRYDEGRDFECVYDIGSLENEDEIAHGLFSLLRDMDDAGVEYIYSEAFHTARLGEAIMDRLYRASGSTVIEC